MRGYQGETHRVYDSGIRIQKENYMYGNVVPKPVVEPDRHPQIRIRRRIRINRRRALSMNPGYVIFLLISVIVAVFVCVNFVNLRSKLNGMSAEITELQTTLERNREENNTRYNHAINSVNMEDIRNRAEELGMTYASQGQVIEYRSTSDEYVKQFEEIPKSGVLAGFKKD